jgi:hypothetical protein
LAIQITPGLKERLALYLEVLTKKS